MPFWSVSAVVKPKQPGPLQVGNISCQSFHFHRPKRGYIADILLSMIITSNSIILNVMLSPLILNRYIESEEMSLMSLCHGFRYAVYVVA